MIHLLYFEIVSVLNCNIKDFTAGTQRNRRVRQGKSQRFFGAKLRVPSVKKNTRTKSGTALKFSAKMSYR